MKLEKILSKIDEETDREIEDLQSQHKLNIKKINEKEEKEIKDLEEKLEEKIKEANKKILEDYRKEREFAYEMELLSLKKKLLKDAKDAAKKEVKELSFSDKKEIFQKKLNESMDFNEDLEFTILVPTGGKSDFSEIFTNIDNDSIKERKMDEDGFIIEGERFVYDVNLSLIVDEAVERESDVFARLLFKE